jgi:hypothetical protein
LLQLDIIPVIVIEGTPPDLKQDVMRKRLAAQGGRAFRTANVTSSKKLTRNNFSSVNREVLQIDDVLLVSIDTIAMKLPPNFWLVGRFSRIWLETKLMLFLRLNLFSTHEKMEKSTAFYGVSTAATADLQNSSLVFYWAALRYFYVMSSYNNKHF